MRTNKSAADRPSEFYPFMHRRKLIKWPWLATVCLLFALGAWGLRQVDASAGTNFEKENSMEAIQTAATIHDKKPPIDAAAYPETKTATFALG